MNQQEVNKKKSHDAQMLSLKDLGVEMTKLGISNVAFSTWVRQLLQGWRQGTVSSKGRSDVSFSRKKPWKQKGTGRARAGSARSPLWRKGGTIFGPQPRTRILKVTKKLKKGVLNTLLFDAFKENNIMCLNWSLSDERPNTRQAYDMLKQANLQTTKINLLLPADDVVHYSSFINIPNVRILSFDELNAFNLSAASKWIVLKKDLDLFKETVARWI
jgi:large subunit ribosomal protein L4